MISPVWSFISWVSSVWRMSRSEGLDGATDFNGRGRTQRTSGQRQVAQVQRGAVAQCFFGGGVGLIVATLRVLKQLVSGGRDVF